MQSLSITFLRLFSELPIFGTWRLLRDDFLPFDAPVGLDSGEFFLDLSVSRCLPLRLFHVSFSEIAEFWLTKREARANAICRCDEITRSPIFSYVISPVSFPSLSLTIGLIISLYRNCLKQIPEVLHNVFLCFNYHIYLSRVLNIRFLLKISFKWKIKKKKLTQKPQRHTWQSADAWRPCPSASRLPRFWWRLWTILLVDFAEPNCPPSFELGALLAETHKFSLKLEQQDTFKVSTFYNFGKKSS